MWLPPQSLQRLEGDFPRVGDFLEAYEFLGLMLLLLFLLFRRLGKLRSLLKDRGLFITRLRDTRSARFPDLDLIQIPGLGLLVRELLYTLLLGDLELNLCRLGVGVLGLFLLKGEVGLVLKLSDVPVDTDGRLS